MPSIFGPEPTYPGSRYKPQWSDNLVFNAPRIFTDWKRERKERSLIIRIGKLVAAAEAYQEQNLPPGNQMYRTLFDQADNAIDSYCKDWNVDRDELTSGWPQYHKLEQLANDDVAKPKPMGLAIVIAGVIGIPVIAALMYLIYSWIIHWGHP